MVLFVFLIVALLIINAQNIVTLHSEKTLNWNDKKIKIKWPIKNPILSKKDKLGLDLDFFK